MIIHRSIPLQLTPQHQCEERLARLAGRSHALMASRATVALVALLRALDLPPSSEVLMPAMLCANPAYAVRWAGLRPLFADISPRTFNIDLDAAQRVIGPQTRVLLAVPLFGQPLDVASIGKFAERHGLIIIEDAAQAAGLKHLGGEPCGSVGICSIYSFGKGKIADAGGGAALLSDDARLLARARGILGRKAKGEGRMNEVASHIVKALDALPRELERRAACAQNYRRRFDLPGITHPSVEQGQALWKYTLLVPDRAERDNMTRDLLAQGIEATNLYSPLSPFFPEARDGRPENYPVSWDVFGRIVNLPLVREDERKIDVHVSYPRA